MKCVIQAGGKGTRLRPYTLVLPKPLIPVGDLPVIEILLKWLRRYGVRDAHITTGYLGHLIRALCGDGSQWDMDIRYTEEAAPMGTVGPLTLLKDALTDTFLVVNGDLLTNLDLREFQAFHRRHGGCLTIGVTRKSVQINLGVVETDGAHVTGFREKPAIDYHASMGIYCMEPRILEFIPRGVPFGFDDLMLTMLDAKEPISVYRHDGMWMDIGRPEDFLEAQDMVKNSKDSFLGY